MASNGSFSINGGGQSTTFGWNLNRQDVAGNYSVIDWWWNANWAATTWYTSTQGALWVNGAEVFRNGYNTSRRLHGGRIAGGQISIPHNSDGSKSFGANGEIAIYNYAINGRGSGYWDLPRIPRNATILSAQDFSDEGNPKITYNNPAGVNVSALSAAIYTEDDSVALASYRGIDKTGSAYTFNLTEDERNAIRRYCANRKTAKVNFYIHSMIAGNQSWTHITKTVSIVNANPNFDWFSYVDANAITKAITGDEQVLIQGKSDLQVFIRPDNRAMAKKMATMTKYIGTINGQTRITSYSSSETKVMNFGALASPGPSVLMVSAQDSRDNQTTYARELPIIPYSSPVLVARAERKNNFDKETKIHIEGTVSLIQIWGVTKNSVDPNSGVQYRYREQGTSSWSDWIKLTSTMGANGVIGTSDFWLNLDNEKAFEFQAKITDRLESSVVNFTVSVGIPIMRIGLDGLVYNKEQPLMPSHVGQVIISTTLNTSEKVQKIYGGSWTEFNLNSGANAYAWKRTS